VRVGWCNKSQPLCTTWEAVAPHETFIRLSAWQTFVLLCGPLGRPGCFASKLLIPIKILWTWLPFVSPRIYRGGVVVKVTEVALFCFWNPKVSDRRRGGGRHARHTWHILFLQTRPVLGSSLAQKDLPS
jgi:hypothetical protein